MSKPTLYLLVGYPGSGKTTAAKIMQRLTGAIHISSDALRLELFPQPTYSEDEHRQVYQTLDQRTEEALALGKDVIYDANLNRFQHRGEKYKLAERTGARPVLVWLQVPRAVARERAVLRGHRHLVPADETFESMFDRVADTIEEPHAGETYLKLDGTQVTMPMVAHALETFWREHPVPN